MIIIRILNGSGSSVQQVQVPRVDADNWHTMFNILTADNTCILLIIDLHATMFVVVA